MDGPFLADSFTLLEDARQIARFLMFDDPADQSLALGRQARIAYVLQQPALTHRGQPADAVITVAAVQGSHRLMWPFLAAVFARPETREPLDFLVYFDAAAWSRRGWNEEIGVSGFPIEREALVYHELKHLRQLVTNDGEPRYHEDGREMLALRSHTYEFFQDEVQRYGPRTLQLEQAAVDIVIGSHAEKVRTRKGKLRLVSRS